jgi:hypothetical protein
VVAAAAAVLCAAAALPLASGSSTAGATAPGLAGNGSVDEAWVTGATPGDALTLLKDGSPVASPANPGTADALGTLVIRDLAPGSGYAWSDTTAGTSTGTFSVLAPDANPATSSALYTGQAMHQGLNYITMRDGIQLAATVRYPSGVTCSAAAPCSTVIEYSGYGTAAPSDPLAALHGQNGGPSNLLPDSSTGIGTLVARAAGFATVSLQMRGTGCSGGAYDLFGYPSDYDAYDAIEIVAHQDWVARHKVAMVGLSYSGLSQFPSAGTNPPDLAAIASLSPTDDLFSTGYPGGIYNNGFAAGWIGARIDDAKAAATWSSGAVAQLSATPVSHTGQAWTYYEIDAELAASGDGSSTCLADQALHGQSQSLSTLVGPAMVAPGTGAGRDPSLFTRRSMTEWAKRITVPVFVAGALQDEQTGPQWPALLAALPSTTPVFAFMVNGGHIDSTDPQILGRWVDFLDLELAQKVPSLPTGVDLLVLQKFASFGSGTSAEAPISVFGVPAGTTPAKALKYFAKAVPRVTVLFDSGAGASGAGNPDAPYLATSKVWPFKGKTTTWYFGPGETMTAKPPATSGSASVVLDPSVRPATSQPARNVWSADPGWSWTTVPATNGLAFATAPFTADTTIVGPATVNLWIKSGTPVLDLQATVTEARPATGKEEYVTSGFLRTSNVVTLPLSSPLFTVPTYLASDAGALSPTAYTLVKVPIAPIGHTFRVGTELRVVLSAPGGDRPTWTFDSVDSGQTATVAYGSIGASSLVVDTVKHVVPSAELPACGALRGEPCRTLQAEGN